MSGATAPALSSPYLVSSPTGNNIIRTHDYILKFLLVGDSDVGKEEILSSLPDASPDSPYGNFKTRKKSTSSVKRLFRDFP